MELAAPFTMNQPAISKHLKVLERGGLISRRRDAQRRPCRLEAQPLAEATQWLMSYREFWAGSFERLDELLDDLKAGEQHRAAPTGTGEHRRTTPVHTLIVQILSSIMESNPGPHRCDGSRPLYRGPRRDATTPICMAGRLHGHCASLSDA